MFDSGISAKELIDELKNTEVDIALDIPDATYVQWLNALQQLLYTEVIREQNTLIVGNAPDNKIDIEACEVPDGEAQVRFEDVIAVYGIGATITQLIKSTVASGEIFPDSYYKLGTQIGVNVDDTPAVYKIVYIVKPALITTTSHGNVSEGANVMVPVEFIDLVKAKLRAEAYKLVNEGDIAANWLNDYNTLLETFKVWMTKKTANFGL